MRVLQSEVCCRFSEFLLPLSILLERLCDVLDPLTDHIRKSNKTDYDLSDQIRASMITQSKNSGIIYAKDFSSMDILLTSKIMF